MRWQRQRRQVAEARDVVEVEMRENDVEALYSGEQIAVFDETLNTGPGIDDERVRPLSQEGAARLAPACRNPTAATQQRPVHAGRLTAAS